MNELSANPLTHWKPKQVLQTASPSALSKQREKSGYSVPKNETDLDSVNELRTAMVDTCRLVWRCDIHGTRNGILGLKPMCALKLLLSVVEWMGIRPNGYRYARVAYMYSWCHWLDFLCTIPPSTGQTEVAHPRPQCPWAGPLPVRTPQAHHPELPGTRAGC